MGRDGDARGARRRKETGADFRADCAVAWLGLLRLGSADTCGSAERLKNMAFMASSCVAFYTAFISK